MWKSPILLALGIAVGVTGGTSIHTTEPAKATAHQTRQQPASASQNTSGIISGAQTPELIPDHVAYSAMFSMFSNRHTETERGSIKAYIRQVVGLGRQTACEDCRQSIGDEDKDIDALLAAAEEFHQRVSILDAQAKEIKDRTWPNPSLEVMAQLTSLQRQKETIIAEIAASLSRRLSGSAMVRVHQHINEHVKRNIRLTPTPPTTPGGSGWQHRHHQ